MDLITDEIVSTESPSPHSSSKKCSRVKLVRRSEAGAIYLALIVNVKENITANVQKIGQQISDLLSGLILVFKALS